MADIPHGFEYVYNTVTGKNVLRPIVGFSDKYLSSDTFLPKSIEVEKSNVKDKPKDKNSNLNSAKSKKNDEFYTSYRDVTTELKEYVDLGYFKDKVVYCPCDKVFNLGRSAFAKYFISGFRSLGIKKLICTQYNPRGNGKLDVYVFNGSGIRWDYHGEYPDGMVDESMIDTTLLNGNGSFDSPECKEIMRSCDIVVTNPPFSLFREFITQIVSMEKKFLIIGNMNAISYKEVFPMIKNNTIWLGINHVKTFVQPDGTTKNFGNICWFTNLEHHKRLDGICMVKRYDASYKKYDNYDAIEVSKVKDIPIDYDGVMGVPISFLEKYSPSQFDIIGLMSGAKGDGMITGNDGRQKFYLDNESVYARVLIKSKHNERHQT